MCLAVPGKILDVLEGLEESEGAAPVGRSAVIDFQGSRLEASLAMTPDAGVGDWVLVHAGFAIAQLDEAEARETFESLQLALGEEVELPVPDSITGTD
jgi:hydrogenase expression/formation protein HypC